MTHTLTLTLTQAEFSAMESITITPESWAQDVIVNRASKAIKAIVSSYTERALDEDIAIPATRDAIVADAFARGWVQAAALNTATESEG